MVVPKWRKFMQFDTKAEMRSPEANSFQLSKLHRINVLHLGTIMYSQYMSSNLMQRHTIGITLINSLADFVSKSKISGTNDISKE